MIATLFIAMQITIVSERKLLGLESIWDRKVVLLELKNLLEPQQINFREESSCGTVQHWEFIDFLPDEAKFTF